jgi:transposase
MNETTLLGIDLAKNVFQLKGLDKHHKTVFKKRLSRAKLGCFVRDLPKCTIMMESCGSSNYWAREFISMGHEVKLISPQHVTPYVGNHKNDDKDTDAILECGTRPRTKFVAVKSLEQQDMQSILRIRERLVDNRVSLSNQLRGLLLEYGVTIAKGFAPLKKMLPELIAAENEELSGELKEALSDSYEEFKELSKRIAHYDKKIEAISDRNAHCRLLRTIPGIGVISSVALYSSVGTGSQFKNGRMLAANIGLVPKQSSSGEKQRLLGIIKKGDADLKKLLVHGARSVAYHACKKTDWRSEWIKGLASKKHANVVAVAIANRTARIAWAVLQSGKPYQAQKERLTEDCTRSPHLNHAL